MRNMKTVVCIVIIIATVTISFAQKPEKEYSSALMQEKCEFSSTGRNTYFILEPGYQLILEDKSDGKLVITVLDEIKKIGIVETRVVEENESKNGRTVEISRNFFAVCRQNGGVYYFGEEVDIYKDGKINSHEGAWQATGENKAGVAMPGLMMLGARYYQEIAPKVAMDRAEIVSTSETFTTPAGTFTNCLKTLETTPLEPDEHEYKMYAPGIGLIKDEDMLLVKYGFLKKPEAADIDPVTVSPDKFKILSENEFVRVVEYTLKPGEKDNRHTHPPKSSYVVSGGKLRITLESGESFEVEEKTGSASWMGRVGKHNAENIGNSVVTIVLTETKYLEK